jgi:hypothetical protein
LPQPCQVRRSAEARTALGAGAGAGCGHGPWCSWACGAGPRSYCRARVAGPPARTQTPAGLPGGVGARRHSAEATPRDCPAALLHGDTARLLHGDTARGAARWGLWSRARRDGRELTAGTAGAKMAWTVGPNPGSLPLISYLFSHLSLSLSLSLSLPSPSLTPCRYEREREGGGEREKREREREEKRERETHREERR